MKIVILSNVNLDLLNKALSKHHEVYEQEGFGLWIQNLINPSNEFKNFSADLIYVVLDGNALIEDSSNKEDAEIELSNKFKYLKKISENFPSASVFISNIDICQKQIIPGDIIRKDSTLMNFWEDKLSQLIINNSNVHLFNIKNIIETIGRKNFYSDKMWYLGSIPYSMKAITALCDKINDSAMRHINTRKKVLVVDLDNTLWGGVLGEDGIEGIKLSRNLIGAAYRDTQKRIKELAEMGVLLAIASKNNEDVVIEALDKHPQMILRSDDFIAISANWNPKEKNIAEIANTLNLGLNSFVFLDDNPVEREAVRQALPDVAVVEFPKDISNLPKTIQKIANEHFFTYNLTNEDKNKTKQYKQEVSRQVALNNSDSIEGYLKSLNIEIIINKMDKTQIERVSQLTKKTNQFNITTRRYTVENIIEFISQENNNIYVGNVTDKYGDSGLVFIVMITINKDVASIENLLMSCRVMGRYIEDSIIDSIERKLEKIGIKRVNAKYITTSKNKPVENLMDRLDYELISNNREEKVYQRILTENCSKRKVLFEPKWR